MRKLQKLERELAGVRAEVASLEAEAPTVKGDRASQVGGALVAARIRAEALQSQIEQEHAEQEQRKAEAERKATIADLRKRGQELAERGATWNKLYLQLTDAVKTLWSEYDALRTLESRLHSDARQAGLDLGVSFTLDPEVVNLRRRKSAPLPWPEKRSPF